MLNRKWVIFSRL